MHKILVLGAGKIGSLAALMFANSNAYEVFLVDIHTDHPDLLRIKDKNPRLHIHQLDIKEESLLTKLIDDHAISTVISSLPYYCNTQVAQFAKRKHLHYFDLTEDVEVSYAVSQLAAGQTCAFMPQCGLAPGFINIVAGHLIKRFSTLDTVRMRVGALPVNVSNALQYSLTWSTDGLINEYGRPCYAIVDGVEVPLQPLEGLEEIKLDGVTYEAFNTSGGLGTLAKTYQGQVKSINYKTIRYPGHCEKMRFLMEGLKLNYDRSTLKRILETALPRTYQDLVLVYVSVTGIQNGQFTEENYVRKFQSRLLYGMRWGAIQLTTASGLCAVVDIVLSHPGRFSGFVTQEQIPFEEFTLNQFGQYYA